MKKVRTCITGIIALIVCSVLLPAVYSFSESDITDEDLFFSSERFFLNSETIPGIVRNKTLSDDLSLFFGRFTDAVYYISSGNYEKARLYLIEARDIWPEYYGTDFLLAMVNENLGDYKMAARFYRSYLKKLKKFHNGTYAISAPIIRTVTPYRIEPYDMAYDMVKRRVALFGMDIESVRPAGSFFRHFIFIFPIIAFIGLWSIVKYVILPRARMRYKVKHPPEGFWVCPRCGTENPVLRKECKKCLEGREE